MPTTPDLRARLDALRARLDARAAGAWRVEGGALIQFGFVAAPDMPAGVASGFASATSSVPLDRRDLGIVEAVAGGRRAVSVAADLPPDAGSGYWLRAFGADRSVAVPIAGAVGPVVGVVAVALPGPGPTDADVEALLLDEAAGWFEAL